MRTVYQVKNVFGGISPTYFFGQDGSYLAALGIDPDTTYKMSGGIRTGGIIMPSQYAKFSGTEVTSPPMWVVTNPKTANGFVYAGAKFHSFDSTLTMRTKDEKDTAFPISVTNGDGSGMCYYNNYIYLFKSDGKIDRYGGMDQGASIAYTADIGSTWSLGAMTHPTMPSIKGVPIPHCPMKVHGDGAMYFAGYYAGGTSCIGKIKTKQTTIQGDTNDGSSTNVLELPFGYHPVAIESYGTDLVIAAITGSSNLINQGPAKLFFWDTFSASFYNEVNLPDPLCTALLVSNGILYVFSGNANNGWRISKYLGGDSLQQILFFEEGAAPFAGAVGAYGDKIYAGSFTTFPEASASVFAYGSKDSRIPFALHGPIKTTSSGANPNVTCLSFCQHASGVTPRAVVGWSDDSAKGLDKLTSGTYTANFASPVFTPGKKFILRKIKVHLTDPVASTAAITLKCYIDSGSSNVTLTAINDTNYHGKRTIVYQMPELADCRGLHDFYLYFSWSGTTQCGIALPIDVEVETYDDEPTS